MDIKLLNTKLDTLRRYIELERTEGKKNDIVDMNLNFIQKMIDIEFKREKNLEMLKKYNEFYMEIPEPIIPNKKLKKEGVIK